MIIKYNALGEAEWAQGIVGVGEGNSYVEIYSVDETSDGSYVVGGCFCSKRIDVGSGI